MAMQTRGIRQIYLALNDGFDSDTLPEDWMSNLTKTPAAQDLQEHGPSSLPESIIQPVASTDIISYLNFLDEERLPSESAPQFPTTTTTIINVSEHSHTKQREIEWLWDHFQIGELPNEWIEKRSRKKRSVDRGSLVLSSTRISGHHVIGLQQSQSDRHLLPIFGSI